MADYDLGTAHGRIVVDYQDKGTGKAVKDLDALKAKAGELLGKFANLARGWRSHSDGMVNDITKVSRAVGVFAGGVAVAAGVLGRSRSAFLAFRGANQIFSSLGLAMGAVPKGAEGFPGVVKKVIQLSAAITLFAGSTKLLQTVASRFRLLSGVGNLIGGLGAKVNSIAGPLHKFAGAALAAANAVVGLRIIRSIIKPVLAFGGALAAAGATLQVVAGLAVSIKDLSGILGLLPAVAGAAVFGFAALKIATMGLSDAFKAWDDPAKFAEALKKLHPEAAKTVLAIKSLEGAFKDAQKRIQGRLFAGLAQEVQTLGKIYIPILERSFGRIVDVVNDVAKSISEMLQESDRVVDMANIGSNIAKVWENLAGVFAPLGAALIDILVVSTEVLAELTGGAKNAARAFNAFIAEARRTGDLKRWILNGVQAMKDLWAIVKNVGLALGGIWKGLNGGEAKSFLAALRDMTARFNEFIRSAQGQRVLDMLGTAMGTMAGHAQKLGDAFLQYVLPALEKFLPIMEKLSGGVIDGIVVAMKVLGPIFQALAVVLTPLAPVLGEIVKWMTALAVIALGVGVALKIAYSAFTLLKVGADVLKGGFAVAGFAARLLTGNLKGAELQALRLAGVLGKNLVKALLSARVAMLLLKWAGIAIAIDAAIGAIKGYSAEQDKAFANQGFMDDVKTFWEDFKNEPFQAVGKEFRASLTPPPSAGADFKRIGDSFQNDLVAPIMRVGARIKESFMTDFVGFFAGLPAKIGGWLSGVGESFNNALVVPIKAAVTRIKESFMTDFVGFFTGLPGMIGGWLSGLGMAVSTAFQSMRTAAQQKFNELAGDAQGLPERIMHALGALVGMALTWVVTTWDAVKLAAQQKFIELEADARALPARIIAAITGFAEGLWQKAVEAWQRFKDGANQKISEAEGDARALPGKIGSAISGLAQQLWSKAVDAWQRFKAAAQQKINEALADIRAFPGKAAAAIAGLAQQLWAKAQEAWQRFKAAALAKMNEAIADVRALPGRLVAALGNIGSSLYQSGVNFIDGFKRGIDAAKQRVLASVQAFMAGLRAYFPFSPAKKGPFSGRGYTSYSGKALVADFANGMLSNKNMIQSAASAAMRAANLSGSFNLSGTAAVARSATSGLASAPPAWNGPASGVDGAAPQVTNNYNVTVPAKDIAEMKNVADFFGKVQQKARAGRAVS